MTVLLSVMVLSAAAAAACVGNPPDEKPSTPGEEAGNYYFDASNGIEYNVSLDGIDLYTYYFGNASGFGDYTKEDGVMTFHPVGDAETTVFTAVLSDDVLVVTYNGGEMRFYKQITYTVSFSSEGGSAIDPVTVMNGRSIEKPADPVRPGYTFLGWYTDSAYSKPFLFGSQPVTANTTLYAYWGENVVCQREFTIDFDLNYDGAEALGSVQTIGGKLYQLPADPVRDGYTFNGWWISMYEGEAEDPSERLSYPYAEGMVFESSATLYAYWTENQSGSKLSAPVVSVDDDSVRWNAVSGVTNYSVKVTGPDDFSPIETTTGSTSITVPFSASSAGDYVISVTAIASNSANNSDTTTIYYKNKALASVSLFSVVDPSVLVFNPVEHADRYYITIECGDKAHKHTMLDLGTSTSYNFSNCAMQQGGILFTVTAEGEGYASSVSRTFVYDRTLAKIEDLRFDDATEMLYWDAIPDAAGYIVSVSAGSGVYKEFDVGGKTQFCLKNFAPVEGGIVVNVYPKTKGYNAPAASEYIYEKTRLATPNDFRIEGTILTWFDCKAESYEIKIGTYLFTEDTNRFDFSSVTDEIGWSALENYQITIRAIGAENSLWSDVEDFRYYTMSATLSYRASIVTWDYVVGADSYEVRVNGGTPISVEGGMNYAEVSLTQAGYNTIEVHFIANNNASVWAKTEAYAYEIAFNSNGGTGVPSQFKAYGDKFDEFAVPERAGYEFEAWYTTPGGPETNGARFEEETFTESGELVLYAYYIPKTYSVNYDFQGGSGSADSGEVVFNSNYEWIVPTTDDATSAFAGWYSEPDGRGLQYTDEKGISFRPWSETQEDVTVYAFWIDRVLSYRLMSDGKGYSVSAGDRISMVTEVTIPAVYNGLPVVQIGQLAFSSLPNLKVINIPDSIQTVDYSRNGSFLECPSLTAINVYQNGAGLAKGEFYSEDGVLFLREESEDGSSSVTTTLIVMPLAKDGVYRVPDGVDAIETEAFKNSKFSEVIISPSVSSIKANAFENSKNLITVVFEPSQGNAVSLSIGARAFRACTALERITLPARLSSISLTKYAMGTVSGTPASQTVSVSSSNTGVTDAFVGCTSLVEINIEKGSAVYGSKEGIITTNNGQTLVYAPANVSAVNQGTYVVPSGVTEIADGAFANCDGITKLVIPNSVKSIGEAAFYDCNNIKEIVFEQNGFDSVTVGKYAFRSNTSLTAVTFESGSQVSVLGEGAFYGCNSLRSFTIPKSMEEIGQQAFRQCVGLREITFAEGGKDLVFKADVFYQCTSLTTFNLPANVTELPGIFSGCTALTTVNVDEDNPYYTSIDGVVFTKNVDKLVFFPQARGGDYVLPDAVVEIESGVFQGNRALTGITFGKNIQVIGERAFQECTELRTVVFTSGGVQLDIGVRAFYKCESLRSLDLPAYTKTIGSYAFAEMDSLQRIGLNEGLTTIGDHAFYDDGLLNNVVIPASLAEMGAYAFSSTYGLTTLTFASNSSLTEISPYAFASSGLTAITIPKSVKTIREFAFYFASGSSSSFTSSLKSIAFEEGSAIEKIGAGAFYYNVSLTQVEIPNTVTEIAPYAFANCRNLATLVFEEGGADLDLTVGAPDTFTLPNSDTQRTVYGYAFYTCSALTQVVIPARVTELGRNAFYQCGNLVTVTFAEGSRLTNIGNEAFRQCSKLSSITIPKTVRNLEPVKNVEPINGGTATDVNRTAIGSSAFEMCYALLKVQFEYNGSSANEVTIGGSAFSSCRSLKEVYLPNRLAAYDSGETQLEPLTRSMFSNCTSLETLEIEEGGILAADGGVVYNGDYTELKFCLTTTAGTVTVPNTVKKIASSAFSDCVSVTEVVFEEGSELTSIGASAFSGCTAIRTIVLPESVDSIGSYAFRNCSKLTDITMPDALNNFDNSIFSGCKVLTNITFEQNKVYESIDGVVFADEGKTLVYYPSTRSATSYVVPDGVTKIAEKAFADNETLRNVTLPQGLLTIENNAFSGSTGLRSINIPNTVTLIDDAAFNGCTYLKDLTFEPGGTSALQIGTGNYPTRTTINEAAGMDFKFTDVFGETYALTSVELPERLVRIEDRAFYSSGLTSVKLPSTLQVIGDYAFNATNLTSLELPEGVTEIGYFAFYSCKTLVSLTLPGSLETLKSYAFANCTKLASVTFAEKSSIETLSNGVFAGCTALTEIELPASITTIPDSNNNGIPSAIGTGTGLSSLITRTFYGCSKLKTITFAEGSNLQTIGNYAFASLTALTSFVIPENVTKIGNYAFTSNSKLTEIVLPDGIKELGDAVFKASGLKSILIPAGLSTIGANVFENCKSLVTFELEEGYSLVGFSDYMFSGCSALKNIIVSGDTLTPGSVTIPEFIISLGDNVFKNCTSIQSVKIPGQVTSIGTNLFNGCTALTSLDLSDLSGSVTELPAYFLYGCTKISELEIPSHITSFGERSFYNTGFVTFEIPSGVTKLPNYVFAGCKNLKEVIFHDKVTELGNYVFQNCTALEEMTLPDSITVIGTYLFSGCTKLKRATLPNNNSLVELPNYLFSGCKALEEFEFPEQITSIGSMSSGPTVIVGVFQNCTALESLTIPETITNIGANAFAGSGLKSITIPSSVTRLCNKVFLNCLSLESVVLEESIYTVLPESTFQGCKALQTVELPESIASIGKAAFQDCTVLTGIGLPSGLLDIGDSAFKNCTSMSVFDAPESLVTIGASAFEGCKNLTQVSLSEATEQIGDRAFYNCSVLKNIFLDHVKQIGANVFNGCALLETIDLPETLETLAESAFTGSGLVEITVPASVANLPAYAFENCKNLKKVVLAEGFVSIGDYAFKDCTNLELIEIPAELISLGECPFSGCSKINYSVAEDGGLALIDGVLYDKDMTILYSYPIWKTGSYTVPENVTIKKYAFANTTVDDLVLSAGVVFEEYAFQYSTIGSIELPDSLTEIPVYAFRGVKSLEEVIIPNNVTAIGDYAFQNAVSLKSLSFAEGGTEALTLGDFAFAGTAIESLVIPARVRIPVTATSSDYAVGASCFSGCDSLTKVVFEESDGIVEGVVRVASKAFEECTSLKSVVFPAALGGLSGAANAEAIGSYVFSGCVNLESVVLSDTAESGYSYGIGSYAFDGCEKLTQFTIPSSVTKIGAYTFRGTGIKEIVVPETVTGSIGIGVFMNCADLEHAVLASPIMKSIYGSFFAGCTSLKSVEIQTETITSIAGSAFANCVSMENFTIPMQITSVSKDAFKGWTSEQTIYIEGGEAQALGFSDGWDSNCEANIVYMEVE